MQFTADERKKEDIFHGLRGFSYRLNDALQRIGVALLAPPAERERYTVWGGLLLALQAVKRQDGQQV